MIVLDASALLAFLFREPGWESVEACISESCISTVNLSEVLGRFAKDGKDALLVARRLRSTPMKILPFSYEASIKAASLRPLTDRLGLSLGDRACLALALIQELPVLTADKDWKRLELAIEIRLIR